MNAVVIDTNVLLVANGSHQDVSATCRAECVSKLLARQKAGVVVIDDGFRILKEYQHKTRPNQPKGVGDAFLKWLLQNLANDKRVHRIAITETQPDAFAEFPDAALQPRNRSLPLCCCRDGWERRERQALARGGDDGAEVAPGGGPTTAAGFDDAGQEREGARPRFGAGTVADVARNHPMT